MNKDVIKVEAPPSKSISHRALMCAALARGLSRLENVLESEDILRTKECLEKLGVNIKKDNGFYLVESPKERFVFNQEVELYGGESGTTFRLISGMLCGMEGTFKFIPAGRMNKRPMNGLEQAVAPHGITFTYLQHPSCPPFILRSQGLKGGVIRVSLEQSSQYLSGLILGSTLAKDKITIEIVGHKVLSWPYVGLTLQVLKEFGGKFAVEILENGQWVAKDFQDIESVSPGKIKFHIYPGSLQARSFRVEGDFSNASYLLAAGAVGQRPVLVQGLNLQTLQGDRAILDILEQMGARLEFQERGVVVFPSALKGIELDMGKCPDLVPTVAVLASLAKGPSLIKGVAHLRLKESDRLEAMARALISIGARVKVLEDGLDIEPGLTLKQPEIFHTYDDHRIAMSVSLYGLKGLKVNLDNPACVAKSFPHFFDVLRVIC
ncbi:MAG: 3-phosphoshikimate 1-carboxyvinyltransferase [Desulfonauticus sp.]|nr:3-phosphoshikimate 1-carboxyvinyltransferase [Desulfonauticus sp.]